MTTPGVTSTTPDPRTGPGHHERTTVAIVGTGFGGLAMALELQRHGFTDFLLLEKGDDVGGVWRENTYPGAACDIPSPYYSLSYEPNPEWSSRFSPQAEIQQYMRRLVDKYRLWPKIRFGCEVTSASFDESSGTWRIEAGDRTVVANVFVPATGQLSRPKLPDIPGLTDFAGTWFHSAQWNHDADLTGKRVAVVGTGASAVQFVPAIQPKVAHLTVFQRSAPWILPRPEVQYRRWHHKLFKRVPPIRLAERFGFWLLCEVISLGLVDAPWMRPLISQISLHKLRKEVPDPHLRAKLTPDYAVGCKRGLFSNDYLPTFSKPNVDLVTTRIERVEPNGVRTSDGRLHEADVIIYGTGFRASEFLGPMSVRGVAGRDLAEVWRDGAFAYKGMTVPGFPNMFLMYGPNTNLGCGSIIYMLETQARYIAQAIREVARQPGVAFDVREDVCDEYNRALQRRLDRSVWTLCSSWYRNASGRVTNNWPGTVSAYRLTARRWHPEDYRTLLPTRSTEGVTV
ncbi:flavin-containing monooxygenase [Thermocrispum agreste]|uniref:NAD(P)/FAD-dependent oxidoreductase n=1 Tax=Thermocrispum agreste TaxID=37925 RepID=A0A2W4JHJ9_9PSEU|nr:NAD(P)/FAD-dependent oxidoreductase [Thermocrispum agreste]PZM97588.1 MAG: NAD(P)/FAD-dependent oxidoreductase [Thermocrispum agreste]